MTDRVRIINHEAVRPAVDPLRFDTQMGGLARTSIGRLGESLAPTRDAGSALARAAGGCKQPTAK